MNYQAQIGARPGKGSQRFPSAVGAAVLTAVVLALACISSLTATRLVAPAGSPLRPPVVVAARAGASAVVRIGDGITSRYEVAPGELVTVPVEVVDAANLGAATLLLTYDPAVVHAVGCAGPQSDVFDGGSCNTEYDLGAVRFNVISVAGANGTHRLYDITFQAVGGDGATQTDLTLTVEYFADPQGNDLAVDTAGGQIEIVGEPLPPDAMVRVGDEHHSAFTLIPGQSIAISVTLSITGTRRLGTATILLRYDPQVVRPTMCTRVDLIDGTCNPNFDPQAGLVKLNIVSADGLVGELHPYDVTFEVRSGVPVEAVSPLVLIVEHFADPLGSSMSWQAVNGSITVAAGPSNSARVLVGAPAETGTYTVALGVTETVSIWVTDVVDLGAATIALDYDPAVVRALGCTARDGPSGIDGGICALHDGQVRVSIISAQGVNGTARLFDVDFTPAPGVLVGATSPVSLTVEYFADTAAQPVPSRVRNGSIEVAAGGDGQAMALVRVGDNGGTFHLPLDGRVPVPIRVEGASGLGAATISLRYDPAVVQPVSCTPGDPVFDGGLCNPRAGDGLARLNVVSLNGFTGDATLFDLTFQAADGAAEGDQTDLSLTVTYFASPSGEPLLYQMAPGMIEIGPPLGPPDVILRAGEAAYQIDIGQRLSVPISATIGPITRPLGAATLALAYDPAVIQPQACTLNDDPADNGFDGGGCNLHYAAGQIKFNALSLAGVTGETTIVEIEFQAVGQGGDITPLTLTVEHLADPAANALTYGVEEGSIGIPPEDGNDDGTPDSQQDNVTSVRNAVDGSFVTLASPADTGLEDVRAMGNPSPQDVPSGMHFPVGFFAFKVRGVEPGGATTVTLFLPAGVAAETYYKYGPTPNNRTSHWYEFAVNGTTGAEIATDRIILHLFDGQRGDEDLTANGEIVDPGAPALCGVDLTATFVSAEPADLRQGEEETGRQGDKRTFGMTEGLQAPRLSFSPSSHLPVSSSPHPLALIGRVSNVGSLPVPGVTVAFYAGDPAAGGALIGTAATTQALSPGASEVVTVTWNAGNPGDYTIYIVADDDGTGTGQLVECSEANTVQQTVSILDVPLVESWNLISTYVNPFNTDTSVVQRPIAGQYVVIQGFDLGTGGAQSYYPDLPPEVNTLKEMDAEHGYWVKVRTTDDGRRTMDDGSSVVGGLSSTAATWRLVGAKWAEDRPIPLDAGWNLVSYLPRQALPVAPALQSIEGQYSAVLGFDGGALSYYPDLDPSFNTLHTLEPIHGYWIRMKQAGTLQYPVTTAAALTTEQMIDDRRQTTDDEQPSSIVHRPSSVVTPTHTWVNFYGAARLPDGTPLPVGTTVRALDPDGVVCGVAVVTTEGQYGLLACYGDDPTTPKDEGARPGDTVWLTVDGQELGAGTWTAHGDLLEVNLGDNPVTRPWQLYLPLLRRGNR